MKLIEYLDISNSKWDNYQNALSSVKNNTVSLSEYHHIDEDFESPEDVEKKYPDESHYRIVKKVQSYEKEKTGRISTYDRFLKEWKYFPESCARTGCKNASRQGWYEKQIRKLIEPYIVKPKGKVFLQSDGYLGLNNDQETKIVDGVNPDW